MSDEKKMRLFIRNADSGEPWAYCGTLPISPATRTAIGGIVAAEIEAADGDGLMRGDNCLTLEVKRVEMTDAEVAALPEM